MTYCVGVLLNDGIVLASDSRTHAGVDNFASFCKMTVFERPGDRVIILLSSGNLAGTQAVVSVLRQRGDSGAAPPAAGAADAPSAADAPAHIWSARTMFDVAVLVSDATREIERRDGVHLQKSSVRFDASFIIGGQIKGEPMRLFRTFAEGNFIEAHQETPFFQTGEAKYGKPIIDRVITPKTSLPDATKCVLVSFDSTMRSNLSVGMPIDLVCYEKDSLAVKLRRRLDQDDPYFKALSKEWREGVRTVFKHLPALSW